MTDQDSEVCVISGTRRQIRELVDGSLEVRVHIDPRFKQDFHRLFPQIDTPVAIAPLALDFERLPKPEKPKGGALSQLAARWCKDTDFLRWMGQLTEEETAAHIREVCGIKSRSELDHNPHAMRVFNEYFRDPYMEILREEGLSDRQR